jgi:hypothetical protein
VAQGNKKGTEKGGTARPESWQSKAQLKRAKIAIIVDSL